MNKSEVFVIAACAVSTLVVIMMFLVFAHLPRVACIANGGIPVFETSYADRMTECVFPQE